MKVKQLLREAELFSIAAHEAVGQIRKYTLEPYWHHPKRVHNILVKYLGEDDYALRMAAWLHDVVEDTCVPLSTIDAWFGPEVAHIVKYSSQVSTPRDGNRAQRKTLDIKHYSQGCFKSKSLKCADLIDNLPSIVEHAPVFALTYLKEKRQLLDVVKGDCHKALWKEANRMVLKMEAKLAASVDSDS